MHDRKKFEEEIQKILENFDLSDETRRQIFSLVMEEAEIQQAGRPQKKQS